MAACSPPVRPEVDLQRLEAIVARDVEELGICPLQHPAPSECPGPASKLRGWVWFGQLHEQYRGQSLVRPHDPRERVVPGHLPPPGWPAIQAPVADLLFENDALVTRLLVDNLVLMDVDTMECDLVDDTLCVARGTVTQGYASPPSAGEPLTVTFPPQFCPYFPGPETLMLWLNESSEGPSPWQVVELLPFVKGRWTTPVQRGRPRHPVRADYVATNQVWVGFYDPGFLLAESLADEE